MKDIILENFTKFIRKHLWFVKFSKTPFLQTTSATATLLKWGTANSVWKTSDGQFYVTHVTTFMNL